MRGTVDSVMVSEKTEQDRAGTIIEKNCKYLFLSIYR